MQSRTIGLSSMVFRGNLLAMLIQENSPTSCYSLAGSSQLLAMLDRISDMEFEVFRFQCLRYGRSGNTRLRHRLELTSHQATSYPQIECTALFVSCLASQVIPSTDNRQSRFYCSLATPLARSKSVNNSVACLITASPASLQNREATPMTLG